MAPALNEPLIQNPELSNTATSVNKSTHATSCDIDTNEVKNASSTANVSGTTDNTSTTTSCSRENHISELAVTFHSSQPMGLPTANELNSNNNINTNSNNSNNSDNNTQQILADLTSNFKGAITAEICLRQQLKDGNLNKDTTSETNTSDLKDILVIKNAVNTLEPMNTIIQNTESTSKLTKINDSHVIEKPLEGERKELNDMEFMAQELKPLHHTIVKEKSNALVNSIVLSAEEMPPISTDSTMSASEVEDNLEERLCQLDGGNIISTEEQERLIISNISNENELQQTQTSTNTTIINNPNNGNDGSGNANTEIEDHDLEEVFKVLKGLDNNTTGNDTLCDLNALFSEVITHISLEEVNASMQQTTSSTSPIKVNQMQENQIQADIKKQQQILDRKLDSMLRRLGKLQARYMCKHISEEISGVFEYSGRSALQKTDDGMSNSNTNIPVICARPPPNLWQDEIKQTVSTAKMSGLIRKLEKVATSQQLSKSTKNTSDENYNANLNNVHNNRKSKKSISLGKDTSTSSSIRQNSITDDVNTVNKSDVVQEDVKEKVEVVPNLNPMVVREMSQVFGLLQSKLREVQNFFDSDATESSSGCESADDMITYNNQIQQTLSSKKRIAWRYSCDRGKIAVRYSWLMSQIADLEIKLRQLTDSYQEKVPITCESNVKQTLNLKPENGYKAMYTNPETEESDESDHGACRTRGIIFNQFRKRRLLQTNNIHAISKRAARPSNIKCDCQWPIQPCALCTGRSDPTAPRELSNILMKPDRVALLDPGYHPVLSFPKDVNCRIYYEAFANMPDWQQRVTRCQVKSIVKNVWKAERQATNIASNKKYDINHPKRRYIKRKDRLISTPNDKVKTAEKLINGTGFNSLNLSPTCTTPLVANSNLL